MRTKDIHEFTFHVLSDKDIKSLKVLDLITRRGIISRTEISRVTGINIVSISNYIKKYIEKNLIEEKGFDVSTGGRKPELVELNKDNRFIGIEISKDHIYAVLTDIGLKVIGKMSKPRQAVGAVEVSAEVCALIEEMVAGQGGLQANALMAIGVGTRDHDYALISSEIRKKFNVDVFVADAASCAAFGEKELNQKIPPGDLLYLYSDLGYAVVVKETGERVSADDSKYLGPWNESLGVVRLAKSDIARGIGTSMVELAKAKTENITESTVAEAAVKNDELALSIIRSVGKGLGLRIAYLINLFNPKSVVLGGGVEKAGDLIFDPIKNMIGKLALKDRSQNCVIIPDTLGEEAVSLGAAFLAAREIFIKA